MGKKGTWADMVDGNEWVVDSGASHHVIGNPDILHDYVEFAEPKLLGTAVRTEVAKLYGHGTVCMEGLNGVIFWLKYVLYAPGLTQILFSIIAGDAQNLILNMNPRGEFVLVRQRSGKKLCDVSKTQTQYLLTANALDGNTEKTYHAMLAREGRVIAASAMLTTLDDTDICELWHRRMGHPSPKALSRLVKEHMATCVRIPNALLNHAEMQMRMLHFREADTLVFFPVHKQNTEATRASAC